MNETDRILMEKINKQKEIQASYINSIKNNSSDVNLSFEKGACKNCGAKTHKGMLFIFN